MRSLIKLISLFFPLVLIACSSQPGTEVSKAKPVAPKNIKVSSVNEGVKITWTPVKDAVRYTVFYGREKGDYKGVVNSEANSIILGGLKKGELHRFAITCWNEIGESNFSDESVFVYDDDPSRATAHLLKANQLMNQGSYREAHAYFVTAISLDPSNAEAYKNRATLYAKIKRDDLAEKDLSTAEKLYKSKPISALPKNRPEN